MAADGRDEAALVARARTGDERAFVELTAAHRGALHAHCYRLLGSLHDADDALQETLLRAWRAIDRFEPGAAPDAPAAAAERREAIGLAFVAAMQLLPPKQRVVLVLRDVLDWSAREVADLLEDSVAAVNSALQRARERLARERAEGSLARVHAPADARTEAAIMRRFQEAWDAVDIDAIVALLADDALLTMPPEGASIPGAAAIGRFFATQPLDGRLDRIRLRPARANGQPALAAYAEDDRTGEHRPYGLMVFAIGVDRIAGITGFPDRPDLFERLGLPVSL